MECLCPNCKANADLVTIDGVEYIKCSGDCGWFQTQADGSMMACEKPASKIDQPAEPELEPESPLLPCDPASTSEGGGSIQAPFPPPSDKPDLEDDGDDINVRVTFED